MEKINPQTPKSSPTWVLICLASGLVSILGANQGINFFHYLSNQNNNQEWTKFVQSPVDPNTATFAELILIPNLGKKLAAEIVSFRKTTTIKGPNDLSLIPGFGDNRLAKLAGYFHFPDATTSGNQDESKKNPQYSMDINPENERGKKQISFTINPNKASQNELEQVPGIGPKLAVKVIETRKIKPFSSLEDLIRVPGIGQKNLERFRPYLELKP